MRTNRLELGSHFRRHVGTRLAEILEVGRRVDEHFAGPVVAEIIVALLVLHRFRPAQEVVLLALRFLREEVVGEAERELAVRGELLDHRVVLGIVLRAAAGVDRAGDAETVQLAHEMPRRVELVLEWQLRSLGKRRVEDARIGLREEEPCRRAIRPAHDLAAGRIRRVPGVADGAQRGGIEDRAIVKVQQEDRRVGGGVVQLGDGRQPLLGELMLGEAADHAHPLRWRRDGDLALEHAHRVREAAHAVPAQLQVVVEPAADDVQVAVDQPGQDAPALEVDDPRLRTRERQYLLVGADGDEAAVADGDGARGRPGSHKRSKQAVMQDQVGGRCGFGHMRAIFDHPCSLLAVGARTFEHRLLLDESTP